MHRTMPLFLIVLALSAGVTTAGQTSGRPSSIPAEATVGAPVNLNTATVAQLEALPGIGRATAERIVEYRQKNGNFRRAEDLMNVRGIGEKSFLRLKELVTVSAPRADRASQ